MKRIDAIILAGGLGTRLRPIIDDRPKVLAPVNNRPFLDIILDQLAKFNMIEHVVLAVGHGAEQIIRRYGRECNYPFEIFFSVEDHLLGTGGGIKKALHLISTELVFVLNGDSYVEVDLNRLAQFHSENGAALTMAVTYTEDANRYGRVVFNDQRRMVSFIEKKSTVQGGYINAGLYLITPDLFSGVDTDRPISLERELIPRFQEKGLYCFIAEGRFIDIGTPESYDSADSFFY
jgi:D-glycero-alpha-D-manno-heptose 1-phosphate guanylyltransferase